MVYLYHLEKFGLMREAIKALSAGNSFFSCVGDSPDQEVLKKQLALIAVDVLLLDMDLETSNFQPLTDCYNFCSRLRQDHPLIRVVLHSPYRHAGWISKFMALGVTGFVSKNSGFVQVSAAVQTVYAGRLFICPVIASQFSNFPDFINKNIPLKAIYPSFTAREMEVLDLISHGLSTKEIATQLFVSEKTVETHRRNLLDKAAVKNTAELIRFVSVRGLLQD